MQARQSDGPDDGDESDQAHAESDSDAAEQVQEEPKTVAHHGIFDLTPEAVPLITVSITCMWTLYKPLRRHTNIQIIIIMKYKKNNTNYKQHIIIITIISIEDERYNK